VLNRVYGPELKIVLESANNDECTFVGCRLEIRMGELDCRPINPNVNWEEGGRPSYKYKKTRWPEPFSAAGPHIIYGCMVGELRRINRLCTNIDGAIY
jgi:hypothetical protein